MKVRSTGLKLLWISVSISLGTDRQQQGDVCGNVSSRQNKSSAVGHKKQYGMGDGDGSAAQITSTPWINSTSRISGGWASKVTFRALKVWPSDFRTLNSFTVNHENGDFYAKNFQYGNPQISECHNFLSSVKMAKYQINNNYQINFF